MLNIHTNNNIIPNSSAVIPAEAGIQANDEATPSGQNTGSPIRSGMTSGGPGGPGTKQKNTQTKNPFFKIPYLGLPDQPITGTSYNFLPIADIVDDVVLMKDGGAIVVLESTSLNFSLLSEKEQAAVIYAYAALLNSLSFSIQIFIRSQVKDISKYMDYLAEHEAKITNPKLSLVMQSYKKFITDSVKKKNVLGKSFYLVIPFSSLEMGVAKSAAILTKKKGPLPMTRDYVAKKAKIALYPKRDHLIRQAGRLGLKLRQLNTEELINLYYNVFNGEPPTARKEQ